MPPKPTKRERKDEAKRRRLEEMKRRQRRTRMRKVYTWVTVAAVIGLIALGVGLSRASNQRAKNRLQNLATAAGCDLPRTFKDEGSTHVADAQQPRYNTNPPTSGNHFNSTIRTGVYAAQPPDGNAVHNLEHGHVSIWFREGQVDRPYLQEFEKIVQANPTRLILAPRGADMQDGYKIAATAWGRMVGCKSPSNPAAAGAVINEFVAQNVGKGPEGDRPGQVGQTSLPPVTTTPTPTPSPTRTGTASPSPTATPT